VVRLSPLPLVHPSTLPPPPKLEPSPHELRLIVQFLPALLVVMVGVVLALTRLLQTVQTRVFKTIPFGALSEFNIVDASIGIIISGMFMLYFGGWWSRDWVG
jgi:hypothetical protein